MLAFEEVECHFPTRQGTVRAVDGVSLSVDCGETVGLVGESGSGKSTLGRIALRLFDVHSGRVRFDGADITTLRGRPLRQLRTQIQTVFQDPISTLNPRMRVGDIVGEPLAELLKLDRRARRERTAEALALVHLPLDVVEAYPRELSGGQAQRVGIARALAVRPALVVADEPVSSLDVSVAAQILNLMAEVRATHEIAYLFISHDLSVVRHLSDRVAVMYLGRLVETGPTEAVFQQPAHPYTAALLSATPNTAGAVQDDRRERIVLTGEIPDPTNVPTGCRFRTRCPIGPAARPGRDICLKVEPTLVSINPGRSSACHFPDEASELLAGTSPVVNRAARTDP